MLGLWNVLHDPTALIAAGGTCDFIIIDLEHGDRDLAQLSAAILACAAGSIQPWVRVSSERDHRVQWLLDAGVKHFVLPQVRSHQQVELFQSRLRYPPLGLRGTHPRRPLTSQLDPVRICPVLETPDAIEDLEAILRVESVDFVYFGAYDLAREMGLPDGPLDPALKEIYSRVSSKVLAGGRRMIAMPNTNLSVKFLAQEATDVLVLGIDEGLLVESIVRQAASMTRSREEAS